MVRKYLSFWLIFLSIHLDFYASRIVTNQFDYIDLKEIPAVLHNDNINLTILYRCSPFARRAISLSVDVERTIYQRKCTVFRRHWYCEGTSDVQNRSVSVRLHRSVAYASDSQSDFHSWPVEHGQLNLIMFDDEQRDENQIPKQVQYDIRFLPVHQRPKMYSERWTPLDDKKVNDEYCPSEPEVVQLVNYPLVLAGGPNGKHVTLPSFTDYNLRWEQAVQLARPKFSIVFWIYIDDYCNHEIDADFCSIFQHVTFDNVHHSPEFFFDRQGHLLMYMFGHSYDLVETGARTANTVPKKDWCRVAFVVDEDTWTLYVTCRKTWHTVLIVPQKASTPYYYEDELGTFIIGGNDHRPSFRGIIAHMDIYRRTALTQEQLPKFLSHAVPSYLPLRISETAQCIFHLSSFEQYRVQLNLLRQRIQKRSTCNAFSFLLVESNPQCSLIGTWRRQFNSSSSNDFHYRFFRALRRRTMNSADDLGKKLYQLAMNLLKADYSIQACQHVLTWLEQAACYDHPAAHSLLAMFHHFGLCGLAPDRTRTIDLLISGALLKDQISLLALGHRHYYGFDGVSQDYDAAYVYYQHVASMARYDIDHPKPDHVSFHRIRLTSDTLKDDQIDRFDWLRDQARRGVVSAQQAVGLLLYNGGQGLARDIEDALRYFRLAAEQNDPLSLSVYGSARVTGNGVEKNEIDGLGYIKEAVRLGYNHGLNALGKHAYHSEKNFTKAAHYWQTCYDHDQDIHCAHHLGVMWAAGHYPPTFRRDTKRAFDYHFFAAFRGQIDSASLVGSYLALEGHPLLKRNSRNSASWARFIADENSAVGIVLDQALMAYRNHRWETSFLFYLYAALAGTELGYFNAGYLCYDLKVNYEAPIDCIEQLLRMSLLKRGDHLRNESYDLLTIAEYYQSSSETLSKSIELYIQLFQQGDPRGLFNLAELEEKTGLISLDIWNQIGVTFENKILKDKYRRLQTIYRYCQSLTAPKWHESYIPCTLAYFKISIIIFLTEYCSILTTVALLTISVWVLRLTSL